MNHTYPLTTATLSNGLRVSVNPDPWVPGVALNLWYQVGSAHEALGSTGFAHLFEHLMFSGSAQVDSGQYDAILQAIGGSSNATTSFDRTNYYETVPQGGLDLALWLEAERLQSLLEAVDQTNLDTQRGVVKEEKRQRYDNVPYGDAFSHIMEFAFPQGHPYSHLPIGSMADLDAASLDDVRAFYHRHYLPNNLVMAVSGAVHPDETIAAVDRYFSSIPAGPLPTQPPIDTVEQATGIPRTQLVRDVPQDVVYCCWLVPGVTDPVSDPLALATAVLTGSMSSRLHEALVKTNLADSVDCVDLGLMHGNSLIVATAACSRDVSPEALEEEMMAHWGLFCAEGPSPVEVERAKRAEVREYFLDCASIKSRADHICGAWALFGDAEELNRHLPIITSLTVDDVGQAAATWLKPESRAVLTYRRHS